MRLLTLAAGLATGYVLGTRAGRGKYEQIVEGARQLRANPTMAQATATAKSLAAPPPSIGTPLAASAPAVTTNAPRRTPGQGTPSAFADPLG
jgi:hypothetical protein